MDGRDLLQQGALGREHVGLERRELLPGIRGLAELSDRVVGDHRPVGMEPGGIGAAAAAELKQHAFLQPVAGPGGRVVVGRVPLHPGRRSAHGHVGLGQAQVDGDVGVDLLEHLVAGVGRGTFGEHSEQVDVLGEAVHDPEDPAQAGAALEQERHRSRRAVRHRHRPVDRSGTQYLGDPEVLLDVCLGKPLCRSRLRDQGVEVVGVIAQPLHHAATAVASTSRAKLSRTARLYSPGTASRRRSRSTSLLRSEVRTRSTRTSQPAST